MPSPLTATHVAITIVAIRCGMANERFISPIARWIGRTAQSRAEGWNQDRLATAPLYSTSSYVEHPTQPRCEKCMFSPSRFLASVLPLFAYLNLLTGGRFVYRHSWRQHDLNLLVIDNRCLSHNGTWYSDADGVVRSLWRVTVCGNPSDFYTGMPEPGGAARL
jgi:hypothetical protein